MKKSRLNIIWGLLFWCLHYTTQAQLIKNNWEGLFLKGKVKYLAVTTQQFSSKVPKKSFAKYFFNKRGFITKSIHQNKSTNFTKKVYKFKHSYDSQSRTVTSIHKNYVRSAERPQPTKSKHCYDTQGRCIAIKKYNDLEETGMIQSIKYDQQGNILEEFDYNLYESSKKIYTYNKKGLKVKESFLADNQILAVKTYLYDAQDHLIEERNFDQSGLLVARTTFKNNTHGLKIEVVNFNNHDLPESKTIYKYNAIKQNTEQINIIYPTLTLYHTKRAFQYDSSGRLTKDVIYNSKGEVSDLESYKFDQAGNILERRFKHGQFEGHQVNTYDSHNNVVTCTSYNKGGKKESIEKYITKYYK